MSYWPDPNDIAAWKALADPEGEWMTERVAIKAEAGVRGDLQAQARRELEALYRWRKSSRRR